jgi:hypothetical protein
MPTTPLPDKIKKIERVILEAEDIMFTIGKTLVLREEMTMDVSNRLSAKEVTIVIITKFKLGSISANLRTPLSIITNKQVPKIPNITRINDAVR